MEREPLLFHIMLGQGFNWLTWLPTILKQKLYKASIDILTDNGLQSKTIL